MAKIKTFSNRSYLVLYMFDEATFLALKDYCEKRGFFPILVDSIVQIEQTLARIQHCLGVFACVNNVKSALELVQVVHHLNVPISFFCDAGVGIPEGKLVKVFNQKLTPANYEAFFEVWLEELLPSRVKELSVFATNYTLKSFMPDLKADVTMVKTPNRNDTNFDIYISCESIAQGFFAGILLKVDSQKLRKFGGPAFQNLSHQQILDYMGEFTNQTLGVINLNLQKVNINARVGLPTVLSAQGFNNLRSGFYTPSCVLEDSQGLIEIKYTFLIPFLKDTDFIVDFETYLNIEESNNVEIF